MEEVTFANGRKAVTFGNQKINFQLIGQEPRNVANAGSGDVCLVSDWP
ncbi:VOC family protein, partial [Vibrio parahaemolyticus]|nr:VOC family protein [Vibrio parahaemolyticus]